MRSKYIAAGIVILIFAGLAVGFYFTRDKAPEDIKEEFREAFELPESEDVERKPAPKPLPAKAYLDVPFAPQAPFANWNMPYQEACEEAAIIMVHYFLQGKSLSRAQMDSEILGMVAWQNKNWGGHYDLEAAQMVDLAKRYYGYKNVRVKYGFSINDLKREIANGNPVILPTAGRSLGNPNFRGAGPLYHAIVVKGYNGNTIITNDPGTRNGLDYAYSAETIMNSAHEWNGGNVYSGRSAMIVITD